jgi:arylsulfatase A-like enzyme
VRDINRRIFLKQVMLAGAGSVLAARGLSNAESSVKRLNVIFIAVDDLNDWVGCFGGNPQAKTPHLDRLAATGGMVFNKAYCPSTVCCPSRSALLTGILPSDSGVYSNTQNLKNAERTKNTITIPQYFSQQGYYSLSRGKIFHKHTTADGLDEGQWAFDEHVQNKTVSARNPDTSNGPANGLLKVDGSVAKGEGNEFDWGATSGDDKGTADYQTALWAAEKLEKGFDKPFFMAVGIAKPHLPWFVPQKYFDLYPLEDIKVAQYRLDDLDDIKRADGKKRFKPTDNFLRVQKYDKFKEAARGYLAAVSYVDDCIGVILDGLAKSKYADNTIVVLWGDHGWYLAEKLRYGKTELWQEAARCPLMIKTPGVTEPGKKCDRVVNLMDLYPTLIDLCGLPEKKDISGRSIKPLLENPEKKWDYPTLTTYHKGNHAVRDERWVYIRYADGSEELYDHENDPMEWTNLAGNSQYDHVKNRLAEWIPTYNSDDSPSNTLKKRS